MNIGIIGTRGIPNQYGGFEQFTEFVAPALVRSGHQVSVYCSSTHPYKNNNYEGVTLIHQYDPEDRVGTAGQFIYDLNCIIDCRKRNFDIILQLGYTSSSVWSFLFPGQTALVTNMDGLEWKRTKYSKKVQRFLLKAEKWAVKSSDSLIADSLGIQNYLLEKYNRPSTYIAYGATLFTSPNAEKVTNMGYKPYSYCLAIARMEPENNMETIIRGYLRSSMQKPLLMIGSTANKFGSFLKSTYAGKRIQFLGPLYDIEALNNMRHFSHYYFHGHSVGGTNPSLLEAMASQSLIIAHDNIFNRSVLEQDAYYFSDEKDIARILDEEKEKSDHPDMIERNNYKISTSFTWDHIVHLLTNFLKDALRTFRAKKGIA